MKIIVFQGGLGNQIFQYFFYQYVKKNVSKCVLGVVRDGNNHNGFELDKYFEVQLKMPSWLHFLFKKYERYKNRLPAKWREVYIFEPNELGKARQILYDGYWQNKKYLNSCAITFKNLMLSEKNAKIKIEMELTDSVALHVRRGDYLIYPHCNLFANICTLDYYKEAIQICQATMKDCRYFVFSDDMEWVKNNLPIDNAVYVDWNVGNDSVYDMYLMSFAKINILANSTFSFWGAYLNKRNIEVIYPQKWFNDNCGVTVPDIFPESWIGLNS